MISSVKSHLKPAAYRARWVVPVDQPAIEGGVVTVAGGHITSVGDRAGSEPVHDLGDVALVPGLVNAHTHLEFSLLAQPIGQPGMKFPDWIRAVVEHRRRQAKTLVVETDGFQRFRRRAAQAGLAEMVSTGTVAAGDIASPDWPRDSFPADGLHATIFMELLGLDPALEDRLAAVGQSFVLDLEDMAGDILPGLSPHAPYSVSPRLVDRVCQLSRQESFPVAMHLAESREELELLSGHTGPLVETLKALSAWYPTAVPRGARPLDYLKRLAAARRALVIHGNYLAADEIAYLAAQRERLSVVYCPRTHDYFGHEAYPLAQMLQADVRVAVGTDSRATNPDLNLFAELRHLSRQHPDVSPATILRMGTLSGAEALGIAFEYGSIKPGKRAELLVVPLSTTSGPVEEAILQADLSTRPQRLADFTAD